MDGFSFISNFGLKCIGFRLISINIFGFEVSTNLLIQNSDSKTQFLQTHKGKKESFEINLLYIFFFIKNYLSKIYLFCLFINYFYCILELVFVALIKNH